MFTCILSAKEYSVAPLRNKQDVVLSLDKKEVEVEFYVTCKQKLVRTFIIVYYGQQIDVIVGNSPRLRLNCIFESTY